jgi:Zn-dependent peptidase ImmA (M78 family)/DNA-binding XRE family transcriptional regulator
MRSVWFNPEMLSLARKSRAKTQSGLARDVGISQSKISKYEAGFVMPSTHELYQIAEYLDYPPEFFAREPRLEGPGISEFFHRKHQGVSIGKLDQIYALAEIRRLEVAKLLVAWETPSPHIPILPVSEFEDDPEKIARTVRAYWQLPQGPVFNMTQTLEQCGGVVFAHNFGTLHVDGFSHRSLNLPPLFHLNRYAPSDRWRWTLAHELGHIVMHTELEGTPKQMEDQANAFAGEFLAPAIELRPMLRNVTIPELASLKLIWKISMQALLMRAYRLEAITDRQRRNLFMKLSQAGYRTREPDTLDPPREFPQLAFQMVRFHQAKLEFDRDEVKKHLAIEEADFRAYYSDPHDVLANL